MYQSILWGVIRLMRLGEVNSTHDRAGKTRVGLEHRRRRTRRDLDSTSDVSRRDVVTVTSRTKISPEYTSLLPYTYSTAQDCAISQLYAEHIQHIWLNHTLGGQQGG